MTWAVVWTVFGVVLATVMLATGHLWLAGFSALCAVINAFCLGIHVGVDSCSTKGERFE